jgi:predicted polyphosphate/ATP-dependent NAD kinase
MSRTPVQRLGLVVNPIAGIGGRVGLKGSDGPETVKAAVALGAVPLAPARAMEAIHALGQWQGELEVLTYPSEMGEDELRACGITPVVLGSIVSGHTTAADTRLAATMMADLGVDLLIFAGGDGTARDICEAVDMQVPVLGIPAGVKIHSSVFAVSPRRAAELIRLFLQGRAELREMEVMDIDEDSFREGRVSARLYGYLMVPFERGLVQGTKTAGFGSAMQKEEIARFVADQMNDEFHYILGPGTTVKAIADVLGIPKSLLGVDVVQRKHLVARDANEKVLLDLIAGRKAKIIVTPIGGQGYVFGRGNQQISPRVIRLVGQANVIVVSTPDKLLSLDGPLLVDTGDYELDEALSRHTRVITGYNEESVWRVDH